MKKIQLTQNKQAIVDDCLFDYLNQWKWFYNNGYAVRKISRGKNLFMHREILNLPNGVFTDHINRDRLDNRIENLRPCTKAQNSLNQKLRSDNKTGFKGVSKKGNKWIALIGLKKKRIYLGIFNSPEEASKAYVKASSLYHGEFGSKG